MLETVFAVTEKALGVPRLIEPSDVASYPEEKSVMTYVGALFQVGEGGGREGGRGRGGREGRLGGEEREGREGGGCVIVFDQSSVPM